MNKPRRKRLPPEVFRLPADKIRQGYYTDKYFTRTREILKKDNHHPNVLMQVFQKKKAILSGIDEAIAIIKVGADNPEKLRIKALYDGDEISPYETVLTIEGDYSSFAHLETLILGVLARRTKIATNTKKLVQAAGGKPILFFAARYDHYWMQAGDGYAAYMSGALGVSTDAQADYWGSEGFGTIPHSLIAVYGGDTVKATEKFAQYIPKEVNIISLVDFDNDSVNTALAVARKLGKRLWGVRLDTSETMVDKSLWNMMGQYNPCGVNEQLVLNVREALDREGFNYVKIVVSCGFEPERIAEFERKKIPVDAYGVGSFIFSGNYDFTADIVMVEGKPCAKAGRTYRPNPRLEIVD